MQSTGRRPARRLARLARRPSHVRTMGRLIRSHGRRCRRRPGSARPWRVETRPHDQAREGRGGGSGSFQTWGEENGQRFAFASVPFYHATVEDLEAGGQRRGEGEGDKTASADDTEMPSPRYSKFRQFIMDGIGRRGGLVRHHSSDERKATLLEAFGDWHRPVGGPSWRS